MTEDDPVTLSDACKAVFGDKVKPSTLRAEASRGRLDLFRIGKRDFTTIRSVREMIEKCRVADRRRGFISTKREAPGLSATDRISSAQAALRQSLERQKSSLRTISEKSTHRSAAHRR